MSTGSERLAADLKVEGLTGPARALAEEAVRIKGRLDEIDYQLTGAPAWFDLLTKAPETVAEVVVDKALAEARQQALALSSVLKTLAGMNVEAAAPAADKADEVAKKRAEKLEKARASQG